MKSTYYLRREWRDNKPMPMDEKKLNELIKLQAVSMRDIDNKSK